MSAGSQVAATVLAFGKQTEGWPPPRLPPRAPIGYVVITFGWSIEFGGMDGFIDELYIRASVRGRGIASEILQELPTALAQQAGLTALHLEVETGNERAQRLYRKLGFSVRDGYHLMTRRF